ATAVKDNGTILWQRQLGLMCQGEPRVLTSTDARSVVVTADQSGRMFSFDTASRPGVDEAAWQSRGEIVAPELEDNPAMPPVLLAGRAPGPVLQVASPGDGSKLSIRQIGFGATGKLTLTSSTEGPLGDSLAGAPALVGNKLVLPLAKRGALVAVTLPWDGKTFH